MNEIPTYNTYDIRPCYETMRIKRAVPLTPPRKEALFSNTVIHVIYRSATRNYTIPINIEKLGITTINVALSEAGKVSN